MYYHRTFVKGILNHLLICVFLGLLLMIYLFNSNYSTKEIICGLFMYILGMFCYFIHCITNVVIYIDDHMDYINNVLDKTVDTLILAKAKEETFNKMD